MREEVVRGETGCGGGVGGGVEADWTEGEVREVGAGGEETEEVGEGWSGGLCLGLCPAAIDGKGDDEGEVEHGERVEAGEVEWGVGLEVSCSERLQCGV